MFCFNCGKQLPDEARFCAYCGTNLSHLKMGGDAAQSTQNINAVAANEEVSNVQSQGSAQNVVVPDTPEGNFILARRYELGVEGVEQNFRKAFDLYTKSAKGGYNEAQFRLACAYENGELTLKVNEEKACDWYEEAARNGHVEAMFVLAEAYEYGYLELEEDEDEAFDYYLKAAENGHVKSQFIVAEAYDLENLGVDEDKEEAHDWYQVAAKNGNVEAMYKLGDMYYWWSRDIADAKEDDEDEDFEVSEEEEQCLNAAKYWLKLAAENGHEHAKTMLKNYFSR